MNAFTHHIFMIIIDPPLQKKCKILLLVLFVVSVENNNLFPSSSRLRCMVLRENGKIISFSNLNYSPAHALAASEYNWYSIRISRSIQGVKININIEEQPHKSHKKHIL